MGLSTIVECQTLFQLVPLPKCVSAKIVHLTRCRLSVFLGELLSFPVAMNAKSSVQIEQEEIGP